MPLLAALLSAAPAATAQTPAATAETSSATAEASPAAASLVVVATEELEKLAAHDGTWRSQQEMMVRNLSRYFALYEVPTSGFGLSRLLGTVERVTLAAAHEIYKAVRGLAAAEGSPRVRAADVERVLEAGLPRRPTEYGEVVFFPQADAAEQVVIEEIDLAAFRDTGFPWQILGQLARSELLASADALPLEPEAVRRLGEGLSAYALLLVRLGGAVAQRDYARFLQSLHLREAAKMVGALSQKRQGEAAPSAAGETWFREVAAASGIRFRHVTSEWLAYRRRYGPSAPSFSGGGVSAGDLDGDDRPDLVYCGGQGCAAFRNRGDGSFEDVSAASGLQVAGEARMAVIADFDNDGKSDVFITYARDANRLFHGVGGGRFRDVTTGSGLDVEGDISGPAVAVDYDNDGDLDLYVGNFGDYMRDIDPWVAGGDAHNALPNRLYRNLGNLKFKDVTEQAGVGDTGWAQALSHLDYDNDGDQDLYVANDFGRNDLMVNNGDGTFTPAGEGTGSNDPFHGMNAAFADLNRDGHADIFVTNIWTWNAAQNSVTETNSLLLSRVGADGEVSFERYEGADLLRHDTGWSWGALFLDYDNDADDDLYVVNGFTDYHTFRQFRPNPQIPEQLYAINNGRGPNFLFRNDGGIPNEPMADAGTELADVNSRSIALLDYDADGDVDMAVSTFHAEARLFRNDGAPRQNHWLQVDLVGDPARGSNRDAIGAVVVARDAAGLYVWRMRDGGAGYLGMSSPTLHFGLGQATAVDLEIVWPGGERQQLAGVAADRRIRIRQGTAEYEVVGQR